MWMVNQGDLVDCSCVYRHRPQFKQKYLGKELKFNPYVQEYAIKKLKKKTVRWNLVPVLTCFFRV